MDTIQQIEEDLENDSRASVISWDSTRAFYWLARCFLRMLLVVARSHLGVE